MTACESEDGCASSPCGLTATCVAKADGGHDCVCPEGVEDCSAAASACKEDSCEQGTCREADGTAKCDCKVAYAGDRCEEFRPVEEEASFGGFGWVELSQELMPHVTSEKEEVITLKFQTTESDGMLLWHGQPPSTPGSDRDYLTLGLTDGFLEFSYELGGGPAQMVSNFKVNDGNIHSVSLIRKGRDGSMVVDQSDPVTGKSGGILAMLNTEGNIFVGGGPDLELMTGGKHSQGFNGCIGHLQLDGNKVDFLEMATGGQNVLPCEHELLRKRRWSRTIR